MLTNCRPCTHNGTSCPVTLLPIEIRLFQITLHLLQISQNLIYIHLSSTVMVAVKPIPEHTWLQFFSPQMFMGCCRPHSAAKQESWRFACWSPRYGCCSRGFPLYYNGWWQGDESKMTFSLMLLIIAAVTIFTLLSLKNIKFTFTSLYFEHIILLQNSFILYRHIRKFWFEHLDHYISF